MYTIFSFDVSLAVVGEAVLFVARATLERFKVAETGVSGRSSRFCRELLLCCNHFRPGHNQQVGLSNYHNLISTTRIVLLFVRLAVALSTSPSDIKETRHRMSLTSSMRH